MSVIRSTSTYLNYLHFELELVFAIIGRDAGDQRDVVPRVFPNELQQGLYNRRKVVLSAAEDMSGRREWRP